MNNKKSKTQNPNHNPETSPMDLSPSPYWNAWEGYWERKTNTVRLFIRCYKNGKFYGLIEGWYDHYNRPAVYYGPYNTIMEAITKMEKQAIKLLKGDADDIKSNRTVFPKLTTNEAKK